MALKFEHNKVSPPKHKLRIQSYHNKALDEIFTLNFKPKILNSKALDEYPFSLNLGLRGKKKITLNFLLDALIWIINFYN